jgi:putative phage-type endonuclease
MSTIVRLVQGSPEWHAHRAKYRNASETPVVLGLSPWATPHQLWQIKTGRAPQPDVTAAMAHGTATEPLARAAYESLTGHVMQPLVLVDGEYSASLDGITLARDLVLEIKCPKSKDSRILSEAKAGRIPVDIYWQLEHQLLVSRADLAHLFVYDGDGGILLEQKPDPQVWDTIRQEWDKFMGLVQQDRPPALTDRDTVVRTDEAWQAAAEAFLALKAEADATASRLDAAKAKLIGLAQHLSEKGFGVSVSRYWKAGNVDYKKVPELAGIDIEMYRSAGREEVRVSMTK